MTRVELLAEVRDVATSVADLAKVDSLPNQELMVELVAHMGWLLGQLGDALVDLSDDEAPF